MTVKTEKESFHTKIIIYSNQQYKKNETQSTRTCKIKLDFDVIYKDSDRYYEYL